MRLCYNLKSFENLIIHSGVAYSLFKKKSTLILYLITEKPKKKLIRNFMITFLKYIKSVIMSLDPGMLIILFHCFL